MIRKSEPARVFALSALAVTAFGSAAAQADDAPAPTLETVVVTGSHIKSADSGALPVQTITSDQIAQTGAVNPEQLLQSVSAAVQGNNNTVAASGSGATSGGVSTVSLRGLGSTRTLVLINGNRVAGGGTITDSLSVDINQVPLAALQRVDVLKDGASAIYGSDAIAGVVNFVLKDNYQGAEISAMGGGTTGGGGTTKRVNGVIGFGDLTQDRFNVMVAANFQKEDALYGAQRNFASSGINAAAGNDTSSGNTFPANVALLGPAYVNFNTVNPMAGNCGPYSVTSPLSSPTVCRYDPSPFVSLLPDAERYSIYSAAHFAITSDVQAYAEMSYSQNRQRFIIQPTPLSDVFAIPSNNVLANQAPYNNGACGSAACSTFNLAPTSPYYPTAFIKSLTGGATPILDVFYRSMISGPRDLTDTSRQPRAVLGIKGNVSDWDFDGHFVYSQTQLTEHDNNGYAAYSKILPLLNSGLVNPFGPTTDPTVLAAAAAANFDGDAYKTKTTLAEFDGNVSRPIMDLPAGQMALAVGGQARKEKFETDPSAAIQSGDISGYGGNFFPQDNQRNVFGVYAELNVPIIQGLTADAAVRYDHYQGTGGKTTPKIDFNWKPIQQLRIRASYGKGFRAPSLAELYQAQTLGVSSPGLSDPARCPKTQSTFDCNTQFNITTGGNPQLKPETSDNYSFGVTFEPIQDLSIGIDAFAIKLQNTIIFGINPQYILADPATYGYLVTRAPPSGCAGCPGQIANISQINVNLGETDVKGFDANLHYRFPETPVGRFEFNLMGSYFATYRIQQPDGSYINVAGTVSPITNGAGGVVPRWHHYATLDWSKGDWGLTVAQNFQSSYRDMPSTDTGTQPDVSRYDVFDVQARYTGVEHLKIAVGARNVFNRNPPYTNAGGQNYFQAGYDPGYADPLGRFIYGEVTYSFDPFTK